MHIQLCYVFSFLKNAYRKIYRLFATNISKKSKPQGCNCVAFMRVRGFGGKIEALEWRESLTGKGGELMVIWRIGG